MNKPVGFTEMQRAWFKKRDGFRCQMRQFDGKRWVQCRHVLHLEVHHIIPRGFAGLHLPENFQLNGSMNGIVLCSTCHRGPSGVHPDTFLAVQKYRGGNKKAFEQMMDVRKKSNLKGIPYWNTQWDWMFNRLVRKNTLRFIRKNPYPNNGGRGNTGRIPNSH